MVFFSDSSAFDETCCSVAFNRYRMVEIKAHKFVPMYIRGQDCVLFLHRENEKG